MPWCETCTKFWNPSSVGTDGRCPTCGRSLERPEARPPDAAAPGKISMRELAGEKRAPWHFKLLVGMVSAYLLWRIIDLVRELAS